MMEPIIAISFLLSLVKSIGLNIIITKSTTDEYCSR